MEYNAYASLAHFRILLLPVGSISRTTFDQWAAVIRTLDNLRLSDIPPGTKDEKGQSRILPPLYLVCTESLSHSPVYAQPKVQGLFTPMLPDPSSIVDASRPVSLPAISLSARGHRHRKLFTDRLPLLHNRRIQCGSERPVST